MLNSKEDYIKIRDKMFGNGEEDRVTVDANVLHSREQCRISRNIDQFYLKELKSLYDGNDLDNSIEFPYPIPLETALPYPSIGDYIEEDKLNEVEFQTSDMFMWSGGEDPDYETLSREDEEAVIERIEKINDESERYSDDVSEFTETHEDNIEELNGKFVDLDRKYENITKDYEDALNEIEEDNSDKIKALDEERNELNKQKSSGDLTIPQWNKKMYELDEKYFDQQDSYIKKRTSNELNYIGQIASKGVEHYGITCEISDENKDFNDGLDERRETNQKNIKKIDEDCLEKRNQVYLKSNGNYGEPYFENYRKLEQDLNGISVYPAAQNVKKAIPWIPSSETDKFIEYNNRLMADWENCRFRRGSGVEMWKKIPGMMETYHSYQHSGDETWTQDFKRFTAGDMIMFKDESKGSEDAYETMTYDVIDNTFRIRFGNRTQSQKIDKLLVPIRCHASGVDGEGEKYFLAEAQFVSVQGQEWLNRRDEEDDLHLKNIQEIDDEFNKDAAELMNGYDNDIYELETQAKLDIEDNDYSLAQALGNQREAFITSTDSIRVEANSLATKGQDNYQLLSQISSMKSDFISNTYVTISEYGELENRIRNQLRQDKRDRLSRYNNEYQSLDDDRRDKTARENERHYDVVRQIQNDYNDEHDAFIEDAEKILSDAQAEKIRSENELSATHLRQREEMNANLRTTWNNKYPDYQVDEDWDFWNLNRPEGPSGEEADRFWQESFVNPVRSKDIEQRREYSALQDSNLTMVANATSEMYNKIAEWEEYSPDARDLFELDANQYASFIDSFHTHVGEHYGSASCEIYKIGDIYAHYTFGAETGKDFPNYEEIDDTDGQA